MEGHGFKFVSNDVMNKVLSVDSLEQSILNSLTTKLFNGFQYLTNRIWSLKDMEKMLLLI